MQNTRLVKFLKTLNTHEIRQFRDFVYSPAFNKNKNISDLFDILFTYYPDFESRDEKMSNSRFGVKLWLRETIVNS